MEYKNTPGPWVSQELPGGHNWLIRDEKSLKIIAEIGDTRSSIDKGFIPGNEILANTALICSAPELLEALQGMVKLWDNLSRFLPPVANEVSYLTARNAINKAINIQDNG